MATLAGYHGNVNYPGRYTAYVHAWSADIIAEELDTTSWQLESGEDNPDLPWRSFIFGLQGWRGTYTCYGSAKEVAMLSSEEATLIELVAENGTLYRGMAMMVGVHPSMDLGGISEVTVDFVGVLKAHRQPTTTVALTTTPWPPTTTWAPPTTTTVAP